MVPGYLSGYAAMEDAFAQWACIFAATQQDFSTYNCKESMRYLYGMMCLFHIAPHCPLVTKSVIAQDATQEELIVVPALRLIADNRYEQASCQLRHLVGGRLNLSIIRVCAYNAASVIKHQLSFAKNPAGFDQGMKHLNHKKRVKILKSLSWFGQLHILLLYGYSWTFVV